MPKEQLLSRRTADECLEALLAYQRLREELQAATANAGSLTDDDIERLKDIAGAVGDRLATAKWWADKTSEVDMAFDTARRGGTINPTKYQRRRFRDAGLAVVARTTNPATDGRRVSRKG